jgi:UDP-glucose 4-epimerase
MIIVIGAGGFLGRHLGELLEHRGERALVVSRRPDRTFLQHFAPSLTSMDAATFASPAGERAIAQARAVVYLKWGSVPATFAEQPWKEIAENVEPAFELFFRVASISPRTKIVFLSSGGTIYGRDGAEPKAETSPNDPISSYGLGKLMGEEALRFVGRSRGTPFAILRVSNAVGRWQRNETQGVVAAALRAVRDGVPLRLIGGGSQVRDFIDADDVAEAAYSACLDTSYPAATWNIGSGVGISIKDLLERIATVIDRPVPVEDAPPRSLDVPYIVLDCRKAAQELGWTAKVPIDRSISDLWKIVSGSS